ncbi:hypothetical protein CQ018_00010 [Arthrobacter sp. MYb227]|uniref:hypothetical protein n=1 Tax=Arthrobacter sp. MYb227 TaxID=1848601 RepID=UPI000CFCFC88|nr:hypothetical protein [Arthrobacter sp. MYb227]PQZ95738.1 hypothetical protein CQ018_00010 [Arthrobacter sp. MYb227]
MNTEQWIAVTRDDGETVGYLEPVTADYDRVQPRSVLGHAVGEALDYLSAEELLCDRGIAELMEQWTLIDENDASRTNLSILEVSPHGIVLADALLTKALVPTERFTVAWPDIEAKLVRSTHV